MIKNLKKKLIAGLLALSVFATAIPATDVYAASGYKGLNGTEVIQLSHVHDYMGIDGKNYKYIVDFQWGDYEYCHSLCHNPIRYTDGHTEDCNAVKYFRYNSRSNKIVLEPISAATFKKVYNTKRSYALKGNIRKWLPSGYKAARIRLDGSQLNLTLSRGNIASMSNSAGASYTYQIRISTNKNMSNSKTYKSIGELSEIYFKINKSFVKAGKYYYVQVRPVYKYMVVSTSNGKQKVIQKSKTVYGPWSSKVQLKVGKV